MIRALVNIGHLATCAGSSLDDVGEIADAAMVWKGDTICWVGKQSQLAAAYPGLKHEQQINAQGALVSPGWIDCHTHLAFAGWRADEFADRCRGKSYLEIAAGGGGIARTVQSTRQASESELLEKTAGHVHAMTRLGVTTVECKSGYGLTLADELKLLRVYRRLAERGPTRVVSTLLGAHTVPVEFRDRREAYLELVCRQMIPEAAEAGLADYCDVFVEQGAFTVDEARRILTAGRDHGLRPKLHADQLSDGGAAQLAAEVGAISADHLEYANPPGLQAMAAAGVVAVALPLASLYLRQPPVQAGRWIEQGLQVAVASDFNPGSAPSYHMPLILTLACTMNQLTPAQALRAITIHAARAIGRDGELGSLEIGKKADFVLVDAPTVEHLAYQFRANPVMATYIGGQCVAPAEDA